MNNNIFDNKLKAALEHLEAPYDASSWAALEQRLNAPFAEEHPPAVEAVDKAVFRTLEQLESPYQPAHWDMLANKMNHAARLRRRVWITKLSEAAIFLLLLVNLDSMLNSESPAEQQKSPQSPAPKHLQAQATERPNGNESPESVGQRGYSIAFADAGSEMVLPDFIRDLIENREEEPFAVSVPLFSPQLATDLASENSSAFSVFANLESLQNDEVQSDGLLFLPMQPIHVKAPKQQRFYAATFANIDKNHVRSTGYSTSSNGYGSGVAIGYRIGKWGVETGLSYNRRQYQPKKEIEIYGNTVNGFYTSYAQSVNAHVVSVPVKVTRRVARFGQATAHATAGVTTNFAMEKNFQYGSDFYPGQAPSSNQSPDSKPKLRKNGQGLLEKGSLGDNMYASADVGLRIEHPIGRRFAAFVEPAYRVALGSQGIGPSPAKINTFSVQAGVLTTL